ncbi:MAG TPA: glycosyltransferase [Polaromonas sp.]|uniref:glycosyltransferase n=1 Tax=Polaromonas sp. TaxID=1869339 RepID=UPI002D33FC18|nr:glycosyltransferase [Polaromonas sp.]HYW57919.1 glycosyltransferase [Polaromonas sp.]
MYSAVPDRPTSTLHLLGHFTDLFTGAERELLDIRRLVAGRRPVRIWSDVAPHRAYAGENLVTVQPFAHQFPKNGVLLIAGVHMRPGLWLKYTKFDRIILFYNLANHGQLFEAIEAVRNGTGIDPELVFVSRMLQRSVGLSGRVIRSLIDLRPFLLVAENRLAALPSHAPTGPGPRPFTVGRVSRDALDKHHPDDPALYRMLASRGIRVRIMGGTCLMPALAGVEGIELLPAGAIPAADFYGGLDVFLYRTGASTEAYGRVVLEAMASGLPVVAHARGGYAEVIEEGNSGFLINTQEQAWDSLMLLRSSTGLRRTTGLAASQKALELHGQDAAESDLDFYLQ